MDERDIRQMLIEIICYVLNGDDSNSFLREKLDIETVTSLYHLSNKHDLTHILSHFIYQNKIDVGDELRNKLRREELMSVYRYERMQYTFDEICSLFDESNISYIPLKGAVIRKYYPEESMRTSCDIDILIHEDDMDTAVCILKERGYQGGERHYHDVSLYSPNNTHIELHFSIQENMENLDFVLKDVWQYAVLTEGHRYELTKDFFVFYMYSHMAYHFVSGGCGIRALMDIWIAEHRMNSSYTCAEELLKEAGIYTFAEEMSRIANMCFTENRRDEFSSIVLKYIFNGGVYGSHENMAAIQKDKIGSPAEYMLRRLFMPYKDMVISYPVLKKIPLLLPLCWIHRWVKALFGGKSKSFIAEVACVNSISDSTVSEAEKICSKLGLR